jgi:hypothetical protein
MNKKLLVGVGVGAGIVGIIYAATRKVEAQEEDQPDANVVMLKWGDNYETGPQTIIYGTTQKLVLTAQNPTSKDWTYNIQWLMGDKVGAKWENVYIPAGQSIDLSWNVIFGPYLPGDANISKAISVADITIIERMILGLETMNSAADTDLNSRISVGDATKIERIILGLDPMPEIQPGIVSGAGIYPTSVIAEEVSTGHIFETITDDITIYVEEPGVTVGTLSVNSTPVGAEIFIDGVSKGISPFLGELEQGTYNGNAKLSGYQDYPFTATVVAGEITAIQFSMVEVIGIEPDINVSPRWPDPNNIPGLPDESIENDTVNQESTISVQLSADNTNQMVTYSGLTQTAYNALQGIRDYVTRLWVMPGGNSSWIQVKDYNIDWDINMMVYPGDLVYVIVNQDCVWTY